MKLLSLSGHQLRRASELLIRLGSPLEGTTAPLQERRVGSWNRAGGNEILFADQQLHSDAIVFDIGGFRGDWSAEIFARYAPMIHIFEPVPQFIEGLKRRFRHNSKIHVHSFGLGAHDESCNIFVQGDASSRFKESAECVEVRIRAIGEVLREVVDGPIALLKMNIEGAEYGCLDQLLQSTDLRSIQAFQIQFHEMDDDSFRRMESIRSRLSRTHAPVVQHEFVWEIWRKQ